LTTPDEVVWEPSADARIRRTLTYCAAGAVAAVLFGLLGLLVVFALGVLAGRFPAAAFLALLVVFVVFGVGRTLVPLREAGALDVRWLDEPLRPRYVLLAGLPWVPLGLLTLRFGRFAVGLLVVFVWALVAVADVLGSRGRIESSPPRLVRRDGASSLAGLRGARSVSLGSLTLFYLSFSPGTGGDAPRLFVVPRRVRADAEAVLDAVDEPGDGRVPSRAERVIVAVVGVSLLAAGPTAWVLLPGGDARVVAAYAGSLFGLFGVVVLWYGLVR
jgi:hypothetical protein